MAFSLMPRINATGSMVGVSGSAGPTSDTLPVHHLPASVWSAFHYYSRLGPLLVHLNAHIDRRLELSEAAGIVHMERTAFSKFFRRATGITYREFLRSVRISKAAGLLLSCDASITEVAFSVGYTDVSLFGKHFKTITGLRPNQYRHECSNVEHVA